MFFKNEDEVTICSSHPEYPTQLIWTFAFPYAEWWCPACGKHEGMLGAGKDVKWTWAIHHRYLKHKKASRKYLRANGVLNCSRFKYRGKWIEPVNMPDKAKIYYRKQSKSWKYKFS